MAYGERETEGRVMRLSVPLPHVYHLEYDTNEEMAESFVRLQEFYESPSFRGRHFTLDEFKSYHVGFFGEWDYYTRWSGFNVPGNVVKLFKSTFQDLSTGEAEILKAVEHTIGDKFYVIASVAGDASTLNHELHHALFYLDEHYRNKATELVSSVRVDKVVDWLLDHDYSKEVMEDEVAAYLMFEQDILLDDGFTMEDLAPHVDTTYSLRLNYFKAKAKHEYYMYGVSNQIDAQEAR
jgi:hypothetical protein